MSEATLADDEKSVVRQRLLTLFDESNESVK
jgi:hypothetical protein